jgi:uncharacterized membrane-anchored protein
MRAVLTAAIKDSNQKTLESLKEELRRHQVVLPGVTVDPSLASREVERPVDVPKANPNNPDQIGNMSFRMLIYSLRSIVEHEVPMDRKSRGDLMS